LWCGIAQYASEMGLRYLIGVFAGGTQSLFGSSYGTMLRRFRRAVALVVQIIRAIVNLWLMRLQGPLTLERRANWVHRLAQTVVGFLDISCSVQGDPPTHGLVVANHLSYLDIAVLAAAMPCFFVAKIEIGGWPFFGKAARLGGTIFIDRSSKRSAQSVAVQMRERLELSIAAPIVLFPEGTSTDGSEVLRFHSRLFDPATSLGVPVTSAGIRYAIPDGRPEREVCWYGNETFVHHLWKVLGMTGFEAEVRFGESRAYTDRRVAADITHDEIAAMRGESALAPRG
jgi:lyso-ornithine lipid O-acyltransferase